MQFWCIETCGKIKLPGSFKRKMGSVFRSQKIKKPKFIQTAPEGVRWRGGAFPKPKRSSNQEIINRTIH